tara:strand:- start:1818 stop:3458 length:1641 start_codon:yes stop_codon:yes gene_type:complete
MCIEGSFKYYFRCQAKRILTQLDRDPDSPTYGCFDRNYWHYKIRDFPSGILQQGLFVLEYLRKYDDEKLISKDTAYAWSLAAINAFSAQVRKGGKVDEYFPWEDSYPAAAFGIYSVCKVLYDWQTNEPHLLKGVHWENIQNLVTHLAKKDEQQAANQYAAAVAGLAIASKLENIVLDVTTVEKHFNSLLKLQDDEGWFYEYGGPDFGYLSVTIDALWDYYEVTNDERAKGAIKKAVNFIASLVGVDNQLPWTLNARNTDYLVPYGLVNFAENDSSASWLVNKLFDNVDDPNHWIWSTDDRYHLHYIFSSLVRAIPFLNKMTEPFFPTTDSILYLPSCGFWKKSLPSLNRTIYIALKKGGLIRVHSNESGLTLCDNGWRLYTKNKIFTSNWWESNNKPSVADSKITLETNLVSTKYHVSKPVYHIALRCLSLVLGKRVTFVLKKMMIFRSSQAKAPHYSREIRLDESSSKIFITDTFFSPFKLFVKRSPRQNLRHVASADSFHKEENLFYSYESFSEKVAPNKKVSVKSSIDLIENKFVSIESHSDD